MRPVVRGAATASGPYAVGRWDGQRFMSAKRGVVGAIKSLNSAAPAVVGAASFQFGTDGSIQRAPTFANSIQRAHHALVSLH